MGIYGVPWFTFLKAYGCCPTWQNLYPWFGHLISLVSQNTGDAHHRGPQPVWRGVHTSSRYIRCTGGHREQEFPFWSSPGLDARNCSLAAEGRDSPPGGKGCPQQASHPPRKCKREKMQPWCLGDGPDGTFVIHSAKLQPRPLGNKVHIYKGCYQGNQATKVMFVSHSGMKDMLQIRYLINLRFHTETIISGPSF